MIVSIDSLQQQDWSNWLPEIDIIPVMKPEELVLPKVVYLNKKENSIKKLGYKNPFVYKNFNFESKALNSKQQDTGLHKWACMICNEVTTNKESLIQHYENHKKQGNTQASFKCIGCTNEFTSSKCYRKHLQLHHGMEGYVCKPCNKTYNNLFQLCIHNFHVHSDGSNYKCILCDFGTLSKPVLRSHIENHVEEGKFKCEICEKTFLRLDWLEEHKVSHAVAMPYQCEICTKSFPYSHYLLAHKKSVHSQPSAILQCHVCDKQFAHEKSLVLHLRSHTGENTVLCDMCGKRLSSSEHLKQHLRIHTGYKPHICSTCGKGFSKKSNLTLHERVHSGEKPYVCRNCGKCFSQRSTLVIHERYHSGERPYTCNLCNKGFVAKGLLGVHLKSCCKIVE